MSSRRFPGKVLAPFKGKPLIAHVVERVSQALPRAPITVLTSIETSDDPLFAYLVSQNIDVFRGSLDNVFERFSSCARVRDCKWLLRICADSPLVDQNVLKRLASRVDEDWDIITTVFPRTFPRGNNAELIRTSTLLGIDAHQLTQPELEHVTSVFYNHPEKFRILNIDSGNPKLAELNLCVDTIEDLRRLEAAQ